VTAVRRSAPRCGTTTEIQRMDLQTIDASLVDARAAREALDDGPSSRRQTRRLGEIAKPHLFTQVGRRDVVRAARAARPDRRNDPGRVIPRARSS
jgi:hypothetical protein